MRLKSHYKGAMPELPEVENVKRDLDAMVVGKGVISSVKLLSPRLRVPLRRTDFNKTLGKSVLALKRRAKYLLFEFADGFLLSHLGMTGSWRLNSGHERLKHDHVVMHLDSGVEIVYHDPRRFGILEWVERKNLEKNRWLKNLGPEPLDEKTFTAEYLFSQLKCKNSPIKTALMNQKLVVGLGNIYVAESLFLAGISPRKKSHCLSFLQVEKLHAEIMRILKNAIAGGGTTIRDYRRGDGKSGSFQSELLVYDRAGEPCKRCDKIVKSMVQAGRSSFWCPQCQK